MADTAHRTSTEEESSSLLGSSWRLISSVRMNDLYHVLKYRCLETGLELVHARVDGPLCHCYWVIPHKMEDNTGMPHLLQHMIWHGSKRYPFSGLFQRIAAKCFSDGPKAWAEKDHSCYQITTAGKDGFAKLLPVVFDHLFDPLLQEASFYTEVFHVDGDGAEHGLCYKEILEMERDPDEIANVELLRMAFGPESSYKYNYAGTSYPLHAEEVTWETVKGFHGKFYNATNCCMVVVGDITKEVVLAAMDPIIKGLVKHDHGKLGNWTKPWLDEGLVQIPEGRIRRIEYPCPIHPPRVAGAVKVAIVGPPSTEKLNRCVAMRLVLEYLLNGLLAETFSGQRSLSVAAFNQIDNLPPTTITLAEYELKQTVYAIEFHNVPLDMVTSVPQILRKTIEKLWKGDGFTLEGMKAIVRRTYQNELFGMENFPHDKILHAVIPDFIYSSQDSDLMFDRRINSAYTIHHFLNQTTDFWKHVIKMCFLDENWLTVATLPSKNLLEKLDHMEKQRIKMRLDPEKIKDTKKWAQKFKASHRLITKQPPNEFLEKFPLPSIASIGFIRIARQDNPEWAKDTLCNLYVDDINSNYVFLTLIMDTSELTLEEKKYLVLFSEGILNSPYVDGSDKFHSAEDCALEISKDVIKYETFFGLEWLGNLEDRTRFSCGNFPHLFCLRLELDVGKVKEGFLWAQKLLWNTKWQSDKLKEVATKLVREVDLQLKRQGPVMTRAMLTDSLYIMDSTPKCVSLIRQKTFLRRIAEELPKSMRRVTKMLEAIRMTILRPENITVHVAASLPRMEFHLTEDPNARDAVSNLFRSAFDYTGWHWGYETKRLSNLSDMNWMRSPDCIAKCSREQILRMEHTSVGYLIQAAPGIRAYNDHEYPYLLTALQYFIQGPEGPLHKQIVGAGLAEEVDIRVSPSEGLLYFEIRSCTDIADAYWRASDLIAKHIGEVKTEDGEALSPLLWDEYLFASAKSSVIFRLTQEENTPTLMAMSSLLGYYKGMKINFNRKLMSAIENTSMEQVQEVAKKYFKPLFLQPCTCAASAPQENAISIIKDLMERCGKRLSLIPPVEHSALASYNM